MSEQTFKPFCFMTHESKHSLINGGNCKGAVPVHGGPSKTAKIPLYTGEVLDRIDELERQLAEARENQADAKRYLWLSAQYIPACTLMGGKAAWIINVESHLPRGDTFDQAIDAAIAQQKL
jgi:hypothetical protein